VNLGLAATPSRREQSKASRRDAIFEAARDLIRDAGSGASAEHIARRAGVSTATLYNLVGPRARLLGGLLSHLFAGLSEHVRAFESADPLIYAEQVVTHSVALFCDDPPLWRHVIHEASGSYAAHVAPYIESQPIDLMIGAMRRAKAARQLVETVDADAAALQVYASYNGALFLWAGEGFTDRDFLDQARSGLWTVVAALGSPNERRRALRELRSCHDQRLRPARTDAGSVGGSSQAEALAPG
jgi:AcrR family transcriptional regulator